MPSTVDADGICSATLPARSIVEHETVTVHGVGTCTGFAIAVGSADSARCEIPAFIVTVKTQGNVA